MAGPGGGPPRKSHTKSRKGCKTCKRRHIRCDETFPQCRNCTKHNTRCDYMDSPPPSDEAARSDGPGGLWPAAVETEVDAWMRTGIFPFPELGLTQSHQFAGLSRLEMRLIHHVASVYRDLVRRSVLPCTTWVERLPLFLEASARYDFVMSAVLAFAAEHLATETSSSEVSNLAYHHRGIAFSGLHSAIGEFSEVNADAALATSILLSWQASEWAGWLSLVQGTNTVLSSMDPWKDSSPLAFFAENNCIFRAPTFMPPAFGAGGGLMAPLLPDDDQSLQEAIHALRQLLAYLQGDAHLRQFVEEILRTAEEIDVCSRTTREDQLFEKLQFLRLRILWAPVGLLQSADPASLNLLVIAHLYAVAMAVDASLPELNGAAFGALVGSPIEDIDRRIRYTSPPNFEATSPIDELMAFPRRMSGKNQQNRVGSVVGSTGVPDPLIPGQQSPYGGFGGHFDSAPHTPNFPPTFPIYGNISQEDLSVPPSPFLSSYVPHGGQQDAGSRRHSALINHSRPNSISLDRRSFSALGYREDSPAYSPAGYGSPAHSYVESDRGSIFGEGSPVPTWGQPAQAAATFSFDESLEKNKQKSMS